MTNAEPLEDAVVERATVDAGVEALNKIHQIEREMLSRAIYVLSDLTGKTPESVVGKLCDGLDEEYQQAAQTLEASSKVAKSLILPSEPKLQIVPKI